MNGYVVETHSDEGDTPGWYTYVYFSKNTKVYEILLMDSQYNDHSDAVKKIMETEK